MSSSVQKPKPGLAAAILLPLAVWLIGTVVAIVFLVLGFTNANSAWEDLARFDADTPARVELSDTGGYRIWVVGDSLTEATFVSATATVTDPEGNPVPVEDYVGALEYGGLDDEGVAVLTFNADQEGVYTIEAASPDGVRFAVGKANPVSDVARGFALFFVIGSVGFLIALILFIILMVRRSRSRKRINQAYGGGFGGGYGQPPGYPPPGGFGPPPGPPPGASWG